MSHYVDGQYFDMLSCGQCGMRFLAPTDWVVVRRDRGDHDKRFTCPNGHVRIWGEAEIEKIRRERDRLKQQEARLIEEREAERKRAELAEARERRLKKRTSAGSCPCCKRTFSNMARHMKSQHPEFACEAPPNLKVVA